MFTFASINCFRLVNESERLLLVRRLYIAAVSIRAPAELRDKSGKLLCDYERVAVEELMEVVIKSITRFSRSLNEIGRV